MDKLSFDAAGTGWSRGPIVALGCLLVFPFVFIWLFFKPTKTSKLPPGPFQWPIIGNLMLLADSSKPIHQIVNDLTKTYGPIMLLKVGIQNFIFVSDPKLAVDVLKVQDSLFSYRPAKLLPSKYLMYGEKHITMGQPGDYNTYFRKLLVTEMLSAKKLQTFQALRMEEHDFFAREAYASFLRGEPFDVRHHIQATTLNVLGVVGFGTRFFGPGASEQLSVEQQKWPSVILEMTACFALILVETLHPSLKWVDTITGGRKRMQNCHHQMDTLLQDILDKKRRDLAALTPKEREEFEPNDFMDLILSLKEDKDFIDDSSVKAIAMDLIIAGSESSSTVSEWAMSELLINPDVMKKAQEEVDSLVGKDRLVDEADASQLPFLAAVIKEAFRLHEPVPWLLPHSCRVPCKVGGYDIPADSFISVNVYGMSRNPSLWDNPLKFDPHRFLSGPSSHIDFKGAHPQLLPFGAGRRICPGLAFAQTLMQTTLARFIHTFDWSLPGDLPLDQFDMSENFSAVAAMKKPLIAVAKPRLSPHVYKSLN